MPTILFQIAQALLGKADNERSLARFRILFKGRPVDRAPISLPHR